MTPAEFSQERRKLVSAIKKRIKPFLYESGYVRKAFSEDNRRLRLWVPRDSQGKPTQKAYTLRNGFVIQTFEGFTEDGVITDSYGHGLATTYWAGIPIEDLYRLAHWADCMMPRMQRVAQQGAQA